MMHSTVYQLPTFTGLNSHGWQMPKFVRDLAKPDTVQHEIDAQVRSGDYFVTLATELDTLSTQIVNQYGARLQLEDIVSDLIYLQDRYEIVKKESEINGF